MKGLAYVLSLVITLGLLFYVVYSYNIDYMKRCREAGGQPVVGNVYMCLKRDMVVVPVQ